MPCLNKAYRRWALGLDDATCSGLKEIVAADKFQLKADVENEALF